MLNSIEKIAALLTSDISKSLSKCGLMFRIFSRVKTESSIRHKLEVKYANKKTRIQDMIGIRIVVYFQDDVDVRLCITVSEMLSRRQLMSLTHPLSVLRDSISQAAYLLK